MTKLKFKRPSDPIKNIPRDWIDLTLPICPFCRKEKPLWEITGDAKYSWNRYFFRCQKCKSIISITVSAIHANSSSMGDGGLPGASLLGFRIEDVGSSGSPLLAGGEVSVENLRRLAGVSTHQIIIDPLV